ncbi:porin [Poriferisphaera sp. WC338]|uniref:porin n=1 Tax=Poriferisphaera sp. WC338 TaxID=3425129 RepID=UPI003D815F04
MTRSHLFVSLLSILLLAFLPIPAVSAETKIATNTRINELEAKVRMLEGRLQDVDARYQEDWLNERRSEEIKTLIDEVLIDANKRTSFMQEGLWPGNFDGKFFLASGDGKFRININGLTQVQYIANQQNGRLASTGGNTQHGFEIRRARFYVHGHFIDPAIGYRLQFETSPLRQGDVFTQEAYGSYMFNDQWKIMVGLMKLPFLREQLSPASGLLAVDRAVVTNLFDLGREVQVQIQHFNKDFRAYAAISTGTRIDTGGIPPRGYYPIGTDSTNLTLTARIDWKPYGDWELQYQNVALAGEANTLMIGAAINYQLGNSSVSDILPNFPGNANYLSFTVDGALDQDNWHIDAAFTGAFLRNVNGELESRNMFGALVEGGYLFKKKYQPFMRYSWLDADIPGSDPISALTFGANIYYHDQNLKWSTDLVWFFEGDVFNALQISPFGQPIFNRIFGFGGATGSFSDNNFIAIRTQFQILF